MNRAWQQLKNVYHFFQSHWWRLFYGDPSRDMHVYGITGSNGKTTTSVVLGAILREHFGKEKVGLLSTDWFWFGATEEANATHMTTTDSKVVWRLLARMKKAGVTHVVMEMTSHALDQHRLSGIRLDGAAIINITHEHLDYHKTMAALAEAKGKIANYLKAGGALVVNKSDEWARKSAERRDGVTWFTHEEAKKIETPLLGSFNKENVLAATLLARSAGVTEAAIVSGVAQVKDIPGRVEWLSLPNGARAVVDFALSPDALERLYQYLRPETKGKLYGVFGAAGRRDKTKRPILTKMATKYLDELILCQDEPYDDPEEEIYQQLEQGLAGATIPWRRIEDRREAIRYALEQAGPGDVVAVTGMGNYDIRVVGDKKIPWKDKDVILELAKEL